MDETRIPPAGDPFYVAKDRSETQDENTRPCLYCLEGWVFLGSLDHDGEEVVECIRCRKCGGKGQING